MDRKESVNTYYIIIIIVYNEYKIRVNKYKIIDTSARTNLIRTILWTLSQQCGSSSRN